MRRCGRRLRALAALNAVTTHPSTLTSHRPRALRDLNFLTRNIYTLVHVNSQRMIGPSRTCAGQWRVSGSSIGWLPRGIPIIQKIHVTQRRQAQARQLTPPSPQAPPTSPNEKQARQARWDSLGLAGTPWRPSRVLPLRRCQPNLCPKKRRPPLSRVQLLIAAYRRTRKHRCGTAESWSPVTHHPERPCAGFKLR